MPGFSTSGILIRRINHGDFDLIMTFFTREKGKIPVIAKYAKKSKKRFAGILELFSVLNMVCTTGKSGGLFILQEAELKQPFSGIRADIKKTAYASYWAELINRWVEEDKPQVPVYLLFQFALAALDRGTIPEDHLSIIFQIKFMGLAGLAPNLEHCGSCRVDTDNIKSSRMIFDASNGNLVCPKCISYAPRQINISKGTIKQLIWIKNNELNKVNRAKFSPGTLKEALNLLEIFVPYQLGIEPKSLKFLRTLRKRN